MGLKIRAGMAMAGLALSWAFGIPFLSGVASYLDTTGNVMVDIADGIGLVSKGIEALENYIDPGVKDAVDKEPPETAAPPPPEQPPVPTQKPVVCKKGKCIPYDPTKDRYLQEQLIRQERKRILDEYAKGSLSADTVISPDLLAGADDDDEDDQADVRKIQIAADAIKKAKATAAATPASQGRQKKATAAPATTPSGKGLNSKKTSLPVKKGSKMHAEAVILDPTNPILSTTQNSYDKSVDNEDSEQASKSVSTWKTGTKKILGSLSGMFDRLNTLLLKVVTKIFPWNRRARRRLVGDSGEDEL